MPWQSVLPPTNKAHNGGALLALVYKLPRPPVLPPVTRPLPPSRGISPAEVRTMHPSNKLPARSPGSFLFPVALIDGGPGGDRGFFKFYNDFIDGGWVGSQRSVIVLKVWLILKRFENNGEAWPSLARIAFLAECSRGHASRAIAQLETTGRVRRISRGRGPKQTTHYGLADAASGATVPPMLPQAQQCRRCCLRRNSVMLPPAQQRTLRVGMRMLPQARHNKD